MTQAELLQIRKEQSLILDNILGNPDELERVARKEYGDKWKIIFAGETHPNNVYQQRLQKSRENNAENKETRSDY
jgi:hypothetical protein